MKRFQITAGILAGICLVFIGIFTLVQNSLGSRLDAQQVCARWAADGTRYAQLSAFISPSAGIGEDSIRSMTTSFDSSYVEASIDANENARLYVYAYSGEADVSISQINKETGLTKKSGVSATATGIGGDFFVFHRLKLLSGNYLDTSDTVLNDTILIDNNLAWQFFGSPDVAGQTLEINGKTCYIAGVFEPDKAYEEFYGDKPRIFMSYSLLNDMGDLNITCVETCMPDPVKNFAANIMEKGISAPKEQIEIVENSSRFRDGSLFTRLRTFSKRSVRTKLVSYPYWENSAVILVDRAALLYVGKVIPIAILVILAGTEIVLGYINRKKFYHFVGDHVSGWWDRVEQDRRRKRRERLESKAQAQLDSAKTAALASAPENINIVESSETDTVKK